MIYSITIKNDELQSASKLKYSFNLRLDLCNTRRPGVRSLHQSSFARIVQETFFRQGDVRAHSGNDHSVGESYLQLGPTLGLISLHASLEV